LEECPRLAKGRGDARDESVFDSVRRAVGRGLGHHRRMEQRHRLHIVDADSRGRAHLASIACDLGHHAEVYSAWAELARRPPNEGILVARDAPEAEGALAVLGQAGIWLPLILTAESPTTARVVEGIKRGALDFLDLPCARERLESAVAGVAQEAAAHARMRQRIAVARERIGALSRREREVLEWLAEGSSNKHIARALGISPRTVEIHRANMMAKLGAHHAAEAVRLQIEARLEEDGPLPHQV
jgi:two-component system, LuxR family, response regulator FixJ